MSDRALEAIALFAKLARAVEQAQDVLARYILPEGGPTSEDALSELLSILDNQKLVVAQQSGAPEPIRIQAQTVLKHAPPPSGADIEVSGAWFKMAQNLARYCYGHPNEAQMQEDDEEFKRQEFDRNNGYLTPISEDQE